LSIGDGLGVAEDRSRLETFPEVCAAIKRALDPKGIRSPGRYGIG
jgi:hypothetical protein